MTGAPRQRDWTRGRSFTECENTVSTVLSSIAVHGKGARNGPLVPRLVYSDRYTLEGPKMSNVTHDLTLSEVLTANGLTHTPSGKGYRRHILDGDRVVFTGTAGQVWAWLRTSNRYPLSAECAA